MLNQRRKRIRILLLLTAVMGGAVLFEPAAFGTSGDRIKIRKRTTLLRAPVSAPGEIDEEFSAEKAAVLAQKRRALIEDIKRFIATARDNEQAAELNLRLGALYMEDYYANMAVAQQKYDIATESWEKGGKKGRAPVLDVSEPKLSLKRARVLYKEMLRRNPRHGRRDEVMYFLAVSSMDEGRIAEGMSYLQQLVAQSPRSKYYPDALVQLADHAFEKNRFREAEQLYDRLIARKHLPLLPYAAYKKGWCAYNREGFTEALRQFRWVITFADSEADSSALRIRNEALRDIVLPFTELRATDEAIEFFREQGAPFYKQGLENMAGIYYEKGYYADTIKVDEILLTFDSNGPKNPDYDIQIIEALKMMNKEDLSAQRLFTRMPTYVTQSAWYEINSSNPAVVQGAFKAFEELTRNYAFRYHSVAQKTKNEALYNRAKGIYSRYVEYFPQTDHTSKVRFYLAEILFKQQLYVAASENYYKVYEDPRAGKLRYDGIRYALSALDRQLNLDRKKAGLSLIDVKNTSKLSAKEEESLELIPYSAVETRFLAIADEYLKHYPTARDCGDVLYEQSYLRYAHHDLADAYKGFWTLISKYPSHATAISSAYLILDILNRKKEYPKLIAACRKFLDTKEMSRASFRAEVSDILRKAELKRIALLETEQKFKEAADNYVEYTKAYGPQDEGLFEKALYNAAVNYTKAGLLLPAVETQEHFLRRFPKSKFRENMLLQVAKTYETLALFDKSAKYFQEFASVYPNHAQAKTALRLAAVYFAGSGHSERAESIFIRFIKLYPAEIKLVERDLLDLYDAQGATEKKVNYYLQARAVRGVSVADYLAATLSAAELSASESGKLPQGLMQEARQIADRYSAEIRNSPKGTEALAKLRFWLVSQRDAQFQRYKLALPQETMAANLKRKLVLLQELEREYGKIASLGNAEWGLGAIYRTAAIYRHLAESVLNAPVPGELTAEQVETYRGELKRQMIDPFNEKARNFAASCLDKAVEFNVMSPWTAQCYRLAAEIEPERYPRIRTFYLPPMMLSLQVPAKESKTEVGGLKRFAYPFYSSSLFVPNRQLASMAPIDLPQIYDLSGGTESQSVAPNPTTYEALTTERRNVLKSHYQSERPDDLQRGASFSFLNVMRLVSADRSVPMIESAIQKDPENPALVNLLGLSYLEEGKVEAARVCWLSLIARNQASASVWNNLGVAANRAGNEDQAISYFQEAVKLPGAKEAWINLGFLALKYRNGFEAKNNFKKALDIDDDDVAAQVGLAVAHLQNREMDDAKDYLISLSRRYSKDPYLKLSLGYFLIDVEHESQIATKIITDYMNAQSLEKDMTFRQLLMEARRVPDTSEQLDSIAAEMPAIEQ